MPNVAEIKQKEVELTEKNLRFVAGLNGYTVRKLAASMKCSDALLYRACQWPADYPATYARICAVLKRRTVD